MSKDFWIIEYERVGEDLASGEIGIEEAAQRLKSLGFDPLETQNHIDALTG